MKNIVVVLSGDPGFYSGAKKLILTIRDRMKKSGEPDRVKTEDFTGNFYSFQFVCKTSDSMGRHKTCQPPWTRGKSSCSCEK